MDTVTYPDHRVEQFIEEHFIPARVHVKQHPQGIVRWLRRNRAAETVKCEFSG
jgi:hypothetical protein